VFEAPGGAAEGLALLKSGEGVFTRDQMRALGGVGHGPIDASINVAGSVFGVDDLNAFADERDRKLVAAIGAG
jgi:hypothetical protein